MKTLHWQEEASCRSLDPDLFFPVAEETVYTDQIAAIRRICAACPAARRCLEWAVATGEPDGIWAGTTPSERRRLRAARRTSRPATGPSRPATRTAGAA
ncbi:WhiB family transcriptional regulator [Actinomadura sp. LD22]|uniref:Transcriptional regulator WhiB n=1 Tax=Actinomadura physcomitrii TaxID=2650748 RepID=A0A6I4MCG2_9ACTN|nr:WhiB family transcriptional regulator [Actinomadura physcomitrii]MWA03412.1 WhiB family transcriptional regulator [Actinomadura physcomitrii]